MTIDDQRRTYEGPVSWPDRLKRARYVLAAAALVFLALDALGILSVVQASIGFLIVAAASLIDFTTAEDHVAAAPSHEGKPLSADWLVEAVVSGLPDAVIALDRRGIVVASNASARAIAPALTRGAPLSFALRIPAIVEAVRPGVVAMLAALVGPAEPTDLRRPLEQREGEPPLGGMESDAEARRTAAEDGEPGRRRGGLAARAAGARAAGDHEGARQPFIERRSAARGRALHSLAAR